MTGEDDSRGETAQIWQPFVGAGDEQKAKLSWSGCHEVDWGIRKVPEVTQYLLCYQQDLVVYSEYNMKPVETCNRWCGTDGNSKLMVWQLHFEPNVNHLEHPLWGPCGWYYRKKMKCIGSSSVTDEIHLVLRLFRSWRKRVNIRGCSQDS